MNIANVDDIDHTEHSCLGMCKISLTAMTILIPLGIQQNYGEWARCQAPVPLSIFRSNSKFDENSERYSFEYTRPITTIFCTRHDSDTVVTCAKYRCARPRIFYTRVF